MNRPTLAALLAGLIALPVQAEEIPSLDDIVVTATRIPTPDVSAPYASEIHGRRAIEQSGAATLYDYLAQQTSLNVMPYAGNRFTPLIDMRGYGIGDGYENLVVTLDGHRFNNIDSMPQLLGAIPLDDIERIEITKGSGSVLFGDGATAGSIQIVTRPHSGVSVAASLGNHGARDLTATAGLRREQASLSATAVYSGLGGYSEPDVSGQRDRSDNRTWRGSLELRPVERLQLKLDGASSRIDTRYVGPLTQAQFRANPAQNGGNSYTHQLLNSDQWGLGVQAELARGWQLAASHHREDKQSDYVDFSALYDYGYDSDDLALQYRGTTLDATVGMQRFDGTRLGATERTRKNNLGEFAQVQYHLGDTTMSAGVRRETVTYAYTPTAGAELKSDHRLLAWDLGINRRLDERSSLFANYNRAFQAPDIDRFFSTDFSVSPTVTSFNGFITPAVSRTLNFGFNDTIRSNRLKLTLFRSHLDHEIYYFSTGPWMGYNTNFDRTHKYGLELQDIWKATETLSASLNYAYTRALIDQASQDHSYDGKNLPGVPRHSITLGLGWQAGPASHLQLTHTWRASAFAADDFANNFAQKQAAYQSTDLAWRYRVKDVELLAAVDNLFAHRNGMWITNDAIYPVNFTRNWRLGAKVSF